jgi:hypothetical protein
LIGGQMEDRINSGLLFVMIDRAADPARSGWDERLRALPGVAKISWWKNVQLNRADWLGKLRTLEDFETLAICEIDGPVDASIVPKGARTLLFRRYPRPSQGVLRLPTLGLSVVMISTRNPTDEVAVQSLRDWGDFVHFPGIVDANIPGYGLVTAYENSTRNAPRFLHLYEFPDPDAEAVFQRTRPCVAQRFGGGPGNPGFDRWELHPEIRIDYVNSFTRLNAAGG